MKISILFIIISLLLFSYGNNSCCIVSQENNSDLKEIKIGTQIWTARNLEESTFRNGDIIPEVKTKEDWLKVADERKPAWCYYKNDSLNGKEYGKLYNIFAVIDRRGLAPNGWHIPNIAEWMTLINYLGGPDVAGLKMKSTEGWNNNSKTDNGNSISGFLALPGGYRDALGEFFGKGYYGCWWTTGYNPNCYINLDYDKNSVDCSHNDMEWYSIRCIKD